MVIFVFYDVELILIENRNVELILIIVMINFVIGFIYIVVMSLILKIIELNMMIGIKNVKKS